MTQVVRPYLSLSNILIPIDLVLNPPSLLDHLTKDIDFELRVRGCELIQEAGVLLRLPQVSIATAQLLYQRYFFIKSFVKYNFEVVAMAATFLASKIDESPRRPRDVINVFHHIRQLENKEKVCPLILDQYYVNVKNQVIKAERRILKELGFAVHSQHPHKLLIIYLQTLECEKNQKFVQIAWNYLNDSYKTNVYVRFQPPSIACACIYLAAVQLQIPLPSDPDWFLIFNVTETDINEIILQLYQLYTRNPMSLKFLDNSLTIARKALEEERALGILSNESKDSPILINTNVTITSTTKITTNPEDNMVEKGAGNDLNSATQMQEKILTAKTRIEQVLTKSTLQTLILGDGKNTEKENKSTNPTRNQDENVEDLILAQQRQSLLYSIQERDKEKQKRPMVSHSPSPPPAFRRNRDVPKIHHKNRDLSHDRNKLAKSKHDAKNRGSSPKSQLNDKSKRKLHGTENVEKSRPKANAGSSSMSLNPTLIAPKKKIMISLKSPAKNERKDYR